MDIKNYWVDIETPAGRVGQGPLRARSFDVGDPLSQSGDWSAEFLASDPNIGSLLEKRTAICRYVDMYGSLQTLGGGVIDQISYSVDGAGAVIVKASGNDLTRELTYRSVGSLQLASGSAGVMDGPSQIMALAPSGWSIVGGTTQDPAYAGFDGDTVLAALCRVSGHLNEHWRLGPGRQVIWLGPSGGFINSGVRAVQHVNDPIAGASNTNLAIITKLEEVHDAADLITRIIPRGSGNGGVMATLFAATDPAGDGFSLDLANNTLINQVAEAIYGRIERVIDFKDLGPLSNTDLDVQNAANMLLEVSRNYLIRYGSPQKSYQIELAGMSRVLDPGTTIRVIYQKMQDGLVLWSLDSQMIILEVHNTLDSTGLHTASILVSTGDRMPVSDTQYLASQAQSAKVFAAHQQLSASVDNLDFRDELDSSTPANFNFWLGAEYTTIQRALVRFKIAPLRSTVKSVGSSATTSSSSGGATPTSSSGGGGTQTSAVGGGTLVIGGTHNHNDPYDPSTVLGYHTHTLSDHSHTVTFPTHTHTVTISSHTHTVTPSINTVYGLFEESPANTLAAADLVISLNGGPDLSSQIVDIGGGWYSLDITSTLVNDIYRPAQEANALQISTAVAKTARVELQLTIRGVVQAVAYS